MRTRVTTRLLALLAMGVLLLLVSGPGAGAAPGDGLATVSTTPPCPSSGIAGIGVAFDGNNILYTCADEAKVHLTDLSGANLGSVDTKDGGGNPVSVDAIA